MSNSNRVNQPSTGQGKKQSLMPGDARKLDKRSEVGQARRHHPELNIGDSDDEPVTEERASNRARAKARR
jgi:hypothetical protein